MTPAERVARLEVLVEVLGKNDERMVNALEKQDGRLDRIEATIAKAGGALAIVVILMQFLGPLIRQALGWPT